MRIGSVDLFRVLAMLMVIALHTHPFRFEPSQETNFSQTLDIFITNIGRFAVPFFFAISGYFWGIKARKGRHLVWFTLAKLKNILAIFLFWNVVYLIPFAELGFGMSAAEMGSAVVRHINELLHQPLIVLIMQGSSLHLWFLVALMVAMAVSLLFVHNKWDKELLLFSVLMYMIGVLAKGYKETPFSIYFGFNTLYGPFFSTVFFASGYHLSKFKPNVKWLAYGLLISIFGSLLHYAEVLTIWQMNGNLPRQDYVFGTYFMGMGFTLIALSNHRFVSFKLPGGVGKLMLGVYAVHYAFVDLFANFNSQHNSPGWELGYVAVVFLLSWAFAFALSKNKFTRKFVTRSREPKPILHIPTFKELLALFKIHKIIEASDGADME